MRPCRKCGSAEKYLNGQCAPCARKRRTKWREKNPGYYAQWCATNPEALKVIEARYREKHRKVINERIAKWTKENPESIYLSNFRRRAAKLRATPKWYSEFDDFVIKEARNLCKLRYASIGVKHQVDHIVPLKSTKVCGFHCAANIQVLPELHNKSKSNRYWPDMP